MNITNHTKKQRLKHNCRSIRLKGYDYSLTGAYFVTVCVHNKKCLLGSINNGVALSPIGKFVNQCIKQIPGRFDSAELDEFIYNAKPYPRHNHNYQ